MIYIGKKSKFPGKNLDPWKKNKITGNIYNLRIPL